MNMILNLKNISKKFKTAKGELPILDNLNISLAPKDFLALRGPSGCGKTTTLLVAGGLLAPDQGSALLNDIDIYTISDKERAKLRNNSIGFVFQQFHLLPYLNALDNILLPGLCDYEKKLQTRAIDLAERFKITDRLHHRPSELSTGERQRVAFARALLKKPALLLADEPTGNLDQENADTILQNLKDFAAEGGAVLLVTHDSRAAEYASQVIELEKVKTPA